MTVDGNSAVSLDGSRIAFEDVGSGPPLLLLHGFSETRTSWTDAGYTDALVAAGYRVILVDARGHGASDRPTDAAAYSEYRRLADMSAVLDALDLWQATVMGYSMGGVAALRAAAFLPGRITGAVALGAHPYSEDLSWLRNMLADGLDSWVMAVDAAVGGLNPACRRRIASNDTKALRAMIAEDRTDFSDALASSGVPVMVILGARDPRHGVVARLQQLPETEVITLDGVDHFGTFFEARKALPRVARFLSRGMRAA